MNRMQYRGYTAIMSLDAEDKVLVGRVVGISDIISFHAESVSEFEARLKSVIDDYISACEQLGVEPDEPVSQPHAYSD